MSEIDDKAQKAFESWVAYHYGSLENFKYCCDAEAIRKGFMAGFFCAQEIQVLIEE